MKIELTEEYVLTTDAHNFILNERSFTQSGNNKGKEIISPIAYYPSIDQLLDGLISKKMLRSKARTLIGLVREHTELLDEIKRLFKTELNDIEKVKK